MVFSDDDLKRISKKYGSKLDEEMGHNSKTATLASDESIDDNKDSDKIIGVTSREYKQFKDALKPKRLTLYEKACNISEKLLPIAPDKSQLSELQEAIAITHLNITPKGVSSFALAGPLALIMIIIFLFFILPFIFSGSASLFIIVISLLIALALMIPLRKVPIYLASNWRLKASNQMVLCIFYIVTYMRHTSNLELAIRFAADRLQPPLSYDLKKVLWDVETEKYKNIKESLDNYLETWKKWNMEFIEAMHLIEGSLYESSESRRVDSLEKSLTVILEETYEKMLHYAHNLQSPLTMLHMLGIVLPILGLVILPLAVSFMDTIKWYHISFLYNLILPVSVYSLGRSILSKRPTGYGDSDPSENPELKKYRNIVFKFGSKEYFLNPLSVSLLIFGVLFFVGILPLLAGFFLDTQFFIDEQPIMPGFQIFDYRISDSGKMNGPFGIGAGILSLCIVAGLGVGLGYYYKLSSANVIKIREETKKLENEFASALFQLGNRLGDGLPAEIAFSKVAEVMEGTTSGSFFRMTSINITKLGMGIEEAIFDKKRGSLVHYPSPIIESGMKVLTESAKKGPLIASRAIVNVSRYIKEMHKVDERLKDLMADIISNMKSQISFLTPAIAGIVIGITSMITTILGNLAAQMKTITETGGEVGGNPALASMFSQGIPSFYFQVIVGLYVVQIVFILTELVNGIENGSDKLQERFLKGQNLVKSTMLYIFIALVVMLIFNMIAGTIMGSLSPGL